jgi:hypothetical protein
MKKIISLVIIFLVAIMAAGLMFRATKPPVEKTRTVQTPAPTVQSLKPQVILKLVSAVSTAKINQPLKLQLVLEPLIPQKIDGFDVVLNFPAKLEKPTDKLELIRQLEENNKLIISFLALKKDQNGFNLTQPLTIGELVIVPNKLGSLSLAFSEKSIVVEALTSKQIPLQLQNLQLLVQ